MWKHQEIVVEGKDAKSEEQENAGLVLIELLITLSYAVQSHVFSLACGT